jgi:glycosyltransferase involved in cell wall biosynthesis
MTRILAPPRSDGGASTSGPGRFSIVVAAYQAAGTIEACLRSALEQTHPAHEVIVVDDGSTDDLEAAVEPFRERIAFVRKPNGGGASARNEGARAMTGDFMAILDADDVYHPRRLEVLSALAASRPDLDLLTTDARFVADGRPGGRFSTRTPFEVDDQRRAIFDTCFVGGWPAVRLSGLQSIGGFDESFRIAYDWDCWLRLILAGARAGFVDECLYDYVLSPASLSANRVDALWERVRLLEKASRNEALRDEERPALHDALLRHRQRAALTEARSSHSGSGRARLARLAASPGLTLGTRIRIGMQLAAPALGGRRSRQNAPETD